MKEKEPIRRAGVIDIGTSSIKLMIGEESQGEVKILESLKNLIPIGKDTFFKDRIQQETINRTVAILEKYGNVLKQYDISNPAVIATTAVREARNRDVFADTIFRRTGLRMDVLTVGDVIYYIDAYLYHRLKDQYPLHTKNLLIAELGSGSLDISLMARGYTLTNIGLPLGTLRLKQLISRLDGSTAENYEAVQEYITNEFVFLKRSLPAIPVDDIILIDETHSAYLSTALGRKKPESNFYQLSLEDSQKLSAATADKTVEDVARDYRIPAEIADTFAGYSIILSSFFALTQNTQIYILEASLSEAVLANIILDYELSQKYNRTNQLISIADALCRKFNVDLAHAQYVAGIADQLFDSLRDLLGVKKSDSLYLVLAAHLHDLGMFIYNRAHHKHTEYIISSLNLFRLSEEEIKIIACIARYHRKGAPAETHVLFKSLPLEKQILVQKLSAILRIANALDRSHKQKIKKLEVKFSKTQDITLQVQVSGNFMLEKLDFMDKKALFEEISGSTVSLKIQSA